jgi:hypothetical protein
MFEIGTGSYLFDSEQEAKDTAKKQGWTVGEKVPNGSLWDFCPRCKMISDEK